MGQKHKSKSRKRHLVGKWAGCALTADQAVALQQGIMPAFFAEDALYVADLGPADPIKLK